MKEQRERKPQRHKGYKDLLFFLCAFVVLSLCQVKAAGPMAARVHYVMGTVLGVQLPADEQSEQLFTSLFAAARKYDEIFSTFKPNSPVSRFNSHGSGRFVAPQEMIELTSLSKRVSEKTDGAFDITVGPLMQCWRKAIERQRMPASDELVAARERVGAAKLIIDQEAITPSIEGMELDFGGIAKGYCVDKMAELLREAGVKNALINFGESSIMALGTDSNDHLWSVSVRDPHRPESTALKIYLKDMAIGTSGSYEHSGRIGRRIINHILDPRTGEPAKTAIGVTVISPSATLADALTKALILLPPADGIKALEKFPGTDAIIFYRDKKGRWQRLLSSGMKNYL
jgi:FAD:protein FMN transferase